MNCSQNLSESDKRWFELIQECRTSGKSDRQWLAENNISSPTFYYHVKQLRKKACEIPDARNSITPVIQDVVPLFIEDVASGNTSSTITETTDSNVAIRLSVRGASVEIMNNATQTVIQNTLTALQFLC